MSRCCRSPRPVFRCRPTPPPPSRMRGRLTTSSQRSSVSIRVDSPALRHCRCRIRNKPPRNYGAQSATSGCRVRSSTTTRWAIGSTRTSTRWCGLNSNRSACRCTSIRARRSHGRCSTATPNSMAPRSGGVRRRVATSCDSSTAEIFDRLPGATVILGHMGEFLPFQLTRFDCRHPALDTRTLDRLPSQYFGTNVKITTSGVYSHAALSAAIDAIGVENVMFAVDYPTRKTSRRRIPQHSAAGCRRPCASGAPQRRRAASPG